MWNIFIPKLSVTSSWFLIISMLPVCAMAIHNTLLKTYMPQMPPCTVMTGNLTMLLVDITALLTKSLRRTHLKISAVIQTLKV